MPPKKKCRTNDPSETDKIRGGETPVLTAGMTRRRGLCNLPTEVLQNEIGYLLDPVDVYNLSQICTELRARFWSKDAALVWRTVMKNASLPQQPSFMSVAAFAHLLFSSNCQICGRPETPILRRCLDRICVRCLPLAVVWYGEADKQVRSVSSDLSDAILHPSNFSEHFSVFKSSSDQNNTAQNLVLQSDVDRVLKRYKEQGAPVSEDDLHAFAAELATHHHDRVDDRDRITSWLRHRRFASILKRLRQNGWGKELDYMDRIDMVTMSLLPHVELEVHNDWELTKAEWPVIMSKLEGFLNETRRFRIQNEYRDVLHPRIDALEAAIVAHCVRLPRTPGMTFRPEAIDFALTPECRAVLEFPKVDIVTADHFAAIVPALIRQWEVDVKEQLTSYLRRHIRQIPTDIDPLTLAVAVFTCHLNKWSCAPVTDLQYPAILSHSCLRRTKLTDRIPSTEEDLYARTVMQLSGSAECFVSRSRAIQSDKPFNTNCLEDGPAADDTIKRIRGIVSALGLSPERATIDEVKACGRWLRCTRCERGGSEKPLRRVYDWVAAFNHSYNHSVKAAEHAEIQDIWQRVDHPKVLAAARIFRVQLERRNPFSTRVYWCCSLCSTFDASSEEIEQHLGTEHGLKNVLQAVREGTIYPHPLKTQNRGCCITFPLHGYSDESGEESLESGSDDTDAGDTASLYSDYVVDEEQAL